MIIKLYFKEYNPCLNKKALKMKTKKKFIKVLVICILSLSLLGIVAPAKAYNRAAWISKEAEYQWLIYWFPGFDLQLNVLTNRQWDSSCVHYYFSSHAEEYSAGLGTGFFYWTEYSEDVDYLDCPVCHRLIIITYEVHGRFTFNTDENNYYDITLAIEYDAGDNIDPTFGPFSKHLEGSWRFYEESGIET